MSKNKPNGFMCFVMDYRKSPGKRNLSVNEAIAMAGPVWEKMNAQQRGPFNERAKREKKSNNPVGKMDCTGRPLTQVQLEIEESQQKERQMKKTIENTVKNSVKMNTLVDQTYFFIMVNYFTKNRDGVFVPAELAVSKFSLKDGVSRKYHSLINPGVDIFGHQYEAQIHADDTHMLPLPPKAMGERNLGKLYNEILNFIRNEETGKLPPVYTSRDFMSQVKSGLEFLQCDVAASEETLDVYPIQYLFFVLKEATCLMGDQKNTFSIYITDAFFERDFFDYEIGIACNYHDEKDRSKYCALSYVTRWGFMFCDYMCSDVAILPIPGSHIPAKVNDNYKTVQNIVKTNHYKNNNSGIAVSMPDIKWEQHWENSSIANDTSSQCISQSDFPALGAKSNKASKPKPISSYAKLLKEQTSIALTENDDDIPDDANNPWTSRSRRAKQQEPDNSAFEINDYDTRTFLSTTMSNDSPSNITLGRGHGRGVPLHVPKTNSAGGRGRGRIYQT